MLIWQGSVDRVNLIATAPIRLLATRILRGTRRRPITNADPGMDTYQDSSTKSSGCFVTCTATPGVTLRK